MTAKRLLIDSYSQPLKKKRKKLPTRETRFFLFQTIFALLSVQRLCAQTVNVTVGTDGSPPPPGSYRAAVANVNGGSADQIGLQIGQATLTSDISPITNKNFKGVLGDSGRVVGGASSQFNSFILGPSSDGAFSSSFNQVAYLGKIASIHTASANLSVSVLNAREKIQLISGKLSLDRFSSAWTPVIETSGTSPRIELSFAGSYEFKDGITNLPISWNLGALTLFGWSVTPGPSDGMVLYGKLSGAGGIQLLNGQLVIESSEANDFTGGTVISEGILSLATSASTLGSGLVTMNEATTLNVGADCTLANAMAFPLSGTAPQIWVSGSYTPNNVFTFSGNFSGGGFEKTGANNMLVTSSQGSYAGNINVVAGSLLLAATDASFGSSPTQIVTIQPNAQIGSISGAQSIASSVKLNGTSATVVGPNLVDPAIGLRSGANLTLLSPIGESAVASLGIQGQTGAEVLNLAGGGSYTGVTVVQDCVLGTQSLVSPVVTLLGTASLRGIGNATIHAVSLETTSQPTLDSGADSLTLNGAISGSLGFKKQGAGTLSVNGPINPLTGPVEVNGGTLSVGGVLGAGSPVTALTGTTVTGGGQVQSLTTAGTLAASDYAALTIADDLTLAASSTTLTNLTTTAVSTFVVGGVAHIDGALVTSVNTLEPFVAGSQYNLVVGTRDGVFSSFSLVGIGAPNEPPASPIIRSQCCTYDACCEKNCGQQAPAARGSSMPKLQLVYEANRVYLEVIGGSFPGGRPLCCPAAGVYDYLSSLEAAEGSDLMTVFHALGKLRECVFDDALVLLSPANWDGMVQTAEELLMLNQTMMSDRVGLIAHTPCADLEPGAKGWVGVVGGATTRGAAESLSGWQAGLVQTGLGADYSTSSGRIGVAFSYGSNHTMWKDVDNSAKWETVGGNLYGSWTGEHVYVFGTAYGAAATAKGARAICFPGVQRWAYNDHSGAAFAMRAGVGYTARWERVSVIPYLEGDLSSIHESAWYETGAHSLNLWVDQRTVNFARATVGIAVAGCRGDRDSGMEALLGCGFTLQTPFHDRCLVSHLGCQSDADCLALSGNNRTQRWFAPIFALKWHGSSRWDFILQANATLSDSIKTGSGLAQLVYRF